MNKITYYVSPQGDDFHDGRSPDLIPNVTGGPFRTLDAAQQSVRRDRVTGPDQQQIRVEVRERLYELSQPWLFTM